MPVGTSNEEIVSADNISFWDLTSLYVDDEIEFILEYKEILGMGLYNNMEYGFVDAFGINYYDAEKTKEIVKRLKNNKPKEFEGLLQWLTDTSIKNGFYILGI